MVLFRSTALQSGWFRDPQLGWGSIASGGLTVYEMPGEHDAMFLEPLVQQLAGLWKECAQQVRARAGAGAPARPREGRGQPAVPGAAKFCPYLVHHMSILKEPSVQVLANNMQSAVDNSD